MRAVAIAADHRQSPLEDAQSMFERLEDPATEDIKILLTPRLGGSEH